MESLLGKEHIVISEIHYEIAKKKPNIVNMNSIAVLDNPLNLEQLFCFEALKLHYDDLKRQFLALNSVTLNKSIIIPKNNKKVSDKYLQKKKKINER